MGYRTKLKSKRLEKQVRNCLLAEISNNKKLNEVSVDIDEINRQLTEVHLHQNIFLKIYTHDLNKINVDVTDIVKKQKQLERYIFMYLVFFIIQAALLLALSMR